MGPAENVALEVAKGSSQGVAALARWVWRKRVRRQEQRQAEYAKLNQELSGDAVALLRTYVPPTMVRSNPADEDEDAPSSPSSGGDSTARFFSQFLAESGTSDDPGSNVLLVLADAGMGKTSMLKMLRLDYLGFANLGVRWPVDRDCQVHKLQRGTGPRLAAADDPARTILLLDALDEDPAAWGQLEARLISLLDLAKGFFRVVVSCRTQFLPRSAEVSGRPDRVLVGPYLCRLVYVSPFSDRQVRRYLAQKYPRRWLGLRSHAKAKAVGALVRSMKSLRSRPLLLAYVDDLIDRDLRAVDPTWSEYQLYREIVHFWLRREEVKFRDGHSPSSATSGQLGEACVRLAFAMSRLGSREISSKEVQAVAEGADTFKALGAVELGGRSLLNKTSNGSYRFAHYSFQEFFIAEAILAGQSFRRLDEGTVRVTQQMLTFILQATEREGVLALTNMDLRDVDLSNASLSSTNFSGSDLRGASFEHARLDGSLFHGANVRGVSFRSASLQGANFSATNIDGCDFTGADLSGAIFFQEDLNRLGRVIGEAKGAPHSEIPLAGGGVIHQRRGL